MKVWKTVWMIIRTLIGAIGTGMALFEAAIILRILGVGLVFFALSATFIWTCLATVWRTFFSKEYELEQQIQKFIRKKTGKICDVEIRDGKVTVTQYERNDEKISD